MIAKVLTYAQEAILRLTNQKLHPLAYGLPWGEYADYNDYDDMSKYYDVDTY